MSEKRATKPTTGQEMVPLENARNLLARIERLELSRALHLLKPKGSLKPCLYPRPPFFQLFATLATQWFLGESQNGPTDYPPTDEFSETRNVVLIQTPRAGVITCRSTTACPTSFRNRVSAVEPRISDGEKDFKSFAFSNAFSKRNRRSGTYSDEEFEQPTK
jgi:hypothetical protein